MDFTQSMQARLHSTPNLLLITMIWMEELYKNISEYNYALPTFEDTQLLPTIFQLTNRHRFRISKPVV